MIDRRLPLLGQDRRPVGCDDVEIVVQDGDLVRLIIILTIKHHQARLAQIIRHQDILGQIIIKLFGSVETPTQATQTVARWHLHQIGTT